jgi:cathepsin L
MKSTSLLGLAVVLALAAEAALAGSYREPFLHNLWNAFKKSHRKEYLNDEHEQYRFDVFTTNVERIEKHNAEYAMGMHSYSLGVNVFADWTLEEFRRHMFGARLGNATSRASGKFVRLPKSVKIDDEVDWRTEGAVTPVKNQGQCGSCWAFSTTGSLEGAHFRQSGTLVSLSEQQLVDCSGKTGNEGCNGGLMDNAFEYIKENGGLDTEQSYPYHAHNEKCHFNKKTVGATCSGFMDIESGDEKALQQAVATVGPVSVANDVTEDNFMFYKEGVFVDDSCSNGRESLNHGVLVVGYGSNSTMDFWLVKNSWGESWGEQGYIRMARNLNNMCGVATAASYPLVK